MIPKEKIAEIKQEMDNCKRPLYFFDDDVDGLCAFLLFYRYIKEGKGIIVKSTPVIDEKFLRKIVGYDPDKIFVLDLADVDQEFIDQVKASIIWIDHHEPLNRRKIKYFNPRIQDINDDSPTSLICYTVVNQDLWIATVGVVSDWYMPDFASKFSELYPDLLPSNIKKPEEALFNTKLGTLIRIFSFNLKGRKQDVMKSIKILTRIQDPYEILEQKTARGKFLYKRYENLNKQYEEELGRALKTRAKGNIVLYKYKEDRMSFTADLANELMYRIPDKIIIIAREKSGEMKCSLRCGKGINILEMIKDSLKDVRGYGGGHKQSCGACIKKQDFNKFIENLDKKTKELPGIN